MSERPREVDLQPANLDVLRGPRENRVNLDAIVRRGVYAILSTEDEDLGGAKPERFDRSLDSWADLKVERNALTAILIADAWPSVVAFREMARRAGSDLGLVRYNPKPDSINPILSAEVHDPVPELLAAMWLTISKGLDNWMCEKKKRQVETPVGEWIPIDHAYSRLAAMVDFGYKSLQIRSDDVTSFIKSGVGTAISTIWGVLDVIPKVFESQQGRPICAQELEAIACNSLSLVLRLAAGSSEIVVPALEGMRGEHSMTPNKKFDPAYFTISNEGSSPRLEIRGAPLRTIVSQDGKPLIGYVPQSPTTGCPAIHARPADAGNVIEDMWAWSLDVARMAYFPRFPQQG